MVVDRVLAIGENFPWIKNVFWIEGPLNLSHDAEQLVSELLAHVFGARDADAVLSRERTLELPHQRRRLIGDLPEFFQIGRAMEIENGANMEQSAGGVTIITRLQSERVHDRLQSAHVIRQLRGTNGRVFNERDRLCLPDAAGQKRETRFAH